MKNLRATEIALETIINLIMNHHYKPGDRLLETGLGEKLNMSRTPIRDALSKLASLGFLEKAKSQKGYLIPLLTPQDMEYVFQTRSLLESYSVIMAIKNSSDKELKKLKDINKKEKQAFYKKDKKKYANFNQLFHFSIAKMAHNPYLYRFIEQVFWRSRLYIFFFAEFYKFDQNLKVYHKEHQKSSYYEHGLILQSMINRNEEKAEKLIKEHVNKTYQHLLNPKSFLEKLQNNLMH